MRYRGIKVFVIFALLFSIFALPAWAEEKADVAGNKVAGVSTEDNDAVSQAVNKAMADKAAADKIAAETAATVEKAIEDKAAADKAAADSAAAMKKAIADKAAADKAAADKAAADKAAADKAAADKAAADKTAADKAAADKAAADKAAADKNAADKTAADKAAADKAATDKAATDKDAVDKIAAENRAAADKAAADRAVADKAAADRAAADKAAADRAAGNKIAVAVNSSEVLTMYGVERVAIANPDIADVIVISGSEIMVVGKTPGRTTLHVWSKYNRESYTVDVAADDVPIASEIKRIVGLNDIKVTKVGKTIILEGRVNDNYQRTRAEKIASAYAEKVVNMLEITHPVQVRIEAKILELNKNKEDDLGIKWGSDSGSPGLFSFGQSSTNSTWGNSLGKLGKVSDINGVLNALVTSGAAKVLSQPNLVTVSGESASILVGGQVPVPTSNSNGALSVEWKDYGIKLEITPEVNSEGLITGKVKAEVTSIDTANKVAISTSLSIPAIKVRKADAYIALSSGQTMAIAGLLSRDDEKTIYKMPILGDLPVLGSLFRSESFTNNETELVILITPVLVDIDSYVPTNSITPGMKKAIETSR